MEWPDWWKNISGEIEFTQLSCIADTCIPTGIEELDQDLNGGFIPGTLYEISGEAGTGKTNLSLELLKRATELYQGYYLSTQKPVSNKRLESIGLTTERLTIRHSPTTESAMYHITQDIPSQLKNTQNLKLIVIDNIYSFIQEILSEDQNKKIATFYGISIILKYLSKTYSVAIVIINNVVSNMQGGIVPCLGINWTNCINQRWYLEKTQSQRTLTVTHTTQKNLLSKFALTINNFSVILKKIND